jgi:flavin-dependent dehydrogenase
MRVSRVGDGHIAVKYYHRDGEFEEKTRIPVGADGANSRVRRNAFGQFKMPRKCVGIQEWFERRDDIPYFGAIFDREITDFYSWTIPKADCIVVGTALVPGNASGGKFELLKRRLQRYCHRPGRSVGKNSALVVRPAHTGGLFSGTGNRLPFDSAW